MDDVAAIDRSSRLPDPVREPVYRIDRSFEWNAEHGPNFVGPWPSRAATQASTEFFGVPVRSRFGIAASLILHGAWFDLYSRLGFDLLTYKTVRRCARTAHQLPNWLFVDEP